MSSDQDILDQISKLAGRFATTVRVCAYIEHVPLGQINRHKSIQTPASQTEHEQSFGVPSHRGSRGGRGGRELFPSVVALLTLKITHNQAQHGDQAAAHILQEATREAEDSQFIETGL